MYPLLYLPSHLPKFQEIKQLCLEGMQPGFFRQSFTWPQLAGTVWYVRIGGVCHLTDAMEYLVLIASETIVKVVVGVVVECGLVFE